MRPRQAPGPAGGMTGMNGIIRGLGNQVALEAGRAASVGAASVVATASPPLAFAFFAAGACICLTVAGLIWLAGIYGWVAALAIAGGVYAFLALMVFAGNGWRLSTPTLPAAAIAPALAAAEAHGVAEGAAAAPPGAAPGMAGPPPPPDPAAARFERDLELAFAAAAAFRDAAEVGRALRGPGPGRRRRRR